MWLDETIPKDEQRLVRNLSLYNVVTVTCAFVCAKLRRQLFCRRGAIAYAKVKADKADVRILADLLRTEIRP
jgi:hypothetical protein